MNLMMEVPLPYHSMTMISEPVRLAGKLLGQLRQSSPLGGVQNHQALVLLRIARRNILAILCEH